MSQLWRSYGRNIAFWSRHFCTANDLKLFIKWKKNNGHDSMATNQSFSEGSLSTSSPRLCVRKRKSSLWTSFVSPDDECPPAILSENPIWYGRWSKIGYPWWFSSTVFWMSACAKFTGAGVTSAETVYEELADTGMLKLAGVLIPP